MKMWTIAARGEKLAGAMRTTGTLTGDLLLYGDREGVSGEVRAQRALGLLVAYDRVCEYEVVPVDVVDG